MRVAEWWGLSLRVLTKALDVTSGLIGAAVVVLIFTQVTLRFLGSQVPPAFEELGNFLFIWWVFLGAAMTLREVGHPRIAAFVDLVPARLREHVEFAAEFVTLVYFLLLARLGLQIALVSGEPSLSLNVPMTYPFLALAIGGALMFLFQLDATLRRTRIGVAALLTVSVLLLLGYGGYLLAQFNIYLLVIAAAIALFVIGVPVAVVLGSVTLAALGSTSVVNLINYPIRLFDGLNNFVLLSIPLFMLTGALMTHGGISRRLVDFANGLVGWIRGGLGLADIVASVFFADVSGSAVSDTAAIGSIMIPGMVRRGYDRGFATALQSAAGSLGMLFPPSITMILYAWVANVSVARMFLSSFIPGLLVAAGFSVVAYTIARRRNFPRERMVGFRELMCQAAGAFPALVAPVIILGGILSGIFTATEAGVVAAVYALIVGILSYRELKPATIALAWREATISMSRVIFIAGNAIAFSWVLIINQGPQKITELLTATTDNAVVVLILINIIMVLLHIFLEGASTVVAIVPVFLPLLAQLHVDPVFFGIIVMLNSATGLLMPPVGLCLYISTAISGEKLEVVAREVLPFVVALFINIGLLIAFPGLVSFLPDHLMGR
ncbi:MAG TPA: TRAP transporter large permease subunit [Pseudorhodoplanes sp.]|nr:TRAP transporter large permease subunit [Pseudorhodoplanes sp.]